VLGFLPDHASIAADETRRNLGSREYVPCATSLADLSQYPDFAIHLHPFLPDSCSHQSISSWAVD